MNTYAVEITEISSKIVTVEADSPSEAEELVEQQWNDCVYVLNAGDFDFARFNAIEIEVPS